MTYDKIGQLLGLSGARVYEIHNYAKVTKPVVTLPDNLVLKKVVVGPGTLISQTGIRKDMKNQTREFVRIRDNHSCQICRKVWELGTRRFDVHHLDEHREGGEYKQNIRLTVCRWDREHTDRMVTLCKCCHNNLDLVRRKMVIGRGVKGILSGHLKTGQWRSPQNRPMRIGMGHNLLYLV